MVAYDCVELSWLRGDCIWREWLRRWRGRDYIIVLTVANSTSEAGVMDSASHR